MRFGPAYALYAANTVDGGQIGSRSATENNPDADARAAIDTPSKYDSTAKTCSMRSRCVCKYRTNSPYGLPSVTDTARRKLHRNGTSGIAATRSWHNAAAAIVMPPPWLPPATAIRAGSIKECERAASTARTASTCLLYTSDAADDLLCVDLGGRR